MKKVLALALGLSTASSIAFAQTPPAPPASGLSTNPPTVATATIGPMAAGLGLLAGLLVVGLLSNGSTSGTPSSPSTPSTN